MHSRTLACSDAAGRDNNLTPIRLVAALAVIWGHSFAIVHQPGGIDPIARVMNGHTYSGTIAVSVFFALSGFLVTRSYWFKPNITNWIKQRIARIYPGAFVCLLLMLLYVFFVYRMEDGLSFFTSGEVREFLRYNIVLDNARFNIPGSFPENRRPEVLNGSWWTLPGEIRVYLLFGVFAILGIAPCQQSRFRNLRRMVFVIFLSILIGFSYIDHPSMPIILDHPSYASPTRYFLLGCIVFYLRSYILLDGRICLAFLAVPFLAWNDKDVFLFLLMFSSCYIVFFVGYGIKNIEFEARSGDWSFGIYIYGWFAQQVVASFDPNQSPYVNFVFSAAFSILLGWLSWRLVESPMLSLSRRWDPKDPRTILSELTSRHIT